MKLTAQTTTIDGTTHLLFSPQWGTSCGIRRETKEEDILNISDTSDITCPECLAMMYSEVTILRGVKQ